MGSPPICFEILFTNVQPGNDPNIYTVTFTGDVSQVAVGLWATNSSYGYGFQIQAISNGTANSVDVVLEDVAGYNASIDTSGIGGGPTNDTAGYVFSITQESLLLLLNFTPGSDWANYLITRFTVQTWQTLRPPILTPPICLEVLFTNVQATNDPNVYSASLTTNGQGYNGGTVFYGGIDVDKKNE